MRLISTRSIKQGMVLGSTVYNSKGRILIKEDIVLTNKMAQRLEEMGIRYIYIKDELSQGIEIQEPIPSELRISSIRTIEESFLQLDANSLSSNSLIFENNSKLYKNLVQSILGEIKDNHDIQTVLSDVVTYDTYIFQHSFNVTLYSLAIGMELGLSTKQLESLGIGAILHDVGKMLIPEAVLFKPGRLTEDEFQIIKKHSEDGYNILRKLHTIDLAVAHCAFQHHERIDGSGYPRGIREEEIHPFAKIIAVADVFDAVTSNRVYRNAMLPHEALEILYSGAGTLFDTRAVEAFRKSVAIYPTGVTVQLNDNRRGIVSGQNKGLNDRPIIRIISEDNHPVEPYEINLCNQLDLVITDCLATISE
ncbi:histidine kinase [Bacillus coahuilensis p1.1.43]|uniref:Histidine kinase n=1 Tax=Bacillus coahuilensis p1.1.43 TaxID=1150625 RepID=A0A147K630_9BACI|nr:HD-GYP domain-containing protein [Bacillus coahuilensis]KUP05278.1 histidine kinase [Bacillus coahuilensis p1.1.43]